MIAAFMCEDFSVHVVDLQADGLSRQSTLKQDYSAMQAHCIARAPAEAGSISKWWARCEFGYCPNHLYSIAGAAPFAQYHFMLTWGCVRERSRACGLTLHCFEVRVVICSLPFLKSSWWKEMRTLYCRLAAKLQACSCTTSRTSVAGMDGAPCHQVIR